MKLACAAFAAALTLVLTAGCATQSESKPAGPPSPEDMDPAVMEANWTEYRELGAPHERLHELTGTWRGTSTTFHGPPETVDVVLTRHLVLDGRFVLEQYRGEFAGMPFEGLALVGYDNFKDEWTSVWADNFGTGLYVFSGEAGDDLDRVTMQTPMEVNPVTRIESAMKAVTTRTGDDREQFVMYDVYPDGTERKTMEMDLRKTDE